MNKRHLERIFGMIIATTALGARGLACGPCPDNVAQIPLLPPSSDGGVEDAGDWIADECQRKCPNGISCVPTSIPLEDGGAMPAIECTQMGNCGAGRRPLGQRGPAQCWDTKDLGAAGEWLVHAAALEAGSVIAFRELRRDLAALGAPRKLLRAASRAAEEEQRHTRRTQALARRYGARVSGRTAGSTRRASLEELATHNAAEGCVREAFGALVARWQATFAKDAEVRVAMVQIADDEARHAALAHAIDAWARRRLGPAARARVEAARREAAHALLAPRVPDAKRDEALRVLGLPGAAEAEVLAKRFVAAIGIDAAA
ncbi:ferritin-like domain-containing protein [Polyangium sp. y55x31]|uniref:ferritin-like domain-containing protein n=1 Tax=Polyangium sp. y55x31 TaxID=3042688 RepID=UPI0024829CD5|nr:ferritin-like domain-containing protein [Polyangium sp. y55x31]MDI1477801.1 ferritin-like domain-containing protein [Polyangium sp. y55x31]